MQPAQTFFLLAVISVLCCLHGITSGSVQPPLDYCRDNICKDEPALLSCAKNIDGIYTAFNSPCEANCNGFGFNITAFPGQCGVCPGSSVPYFDVAFPLKYKTSFCKCPDANPVCTKSIQCVRPDYNTGSIASNDIFPQTCSTCGCGTRASNENKCGENQDYVISYDMNKNWCSCLVDFKCEGSECGIKNSGLHYFLSGCLDCICVGNTTTAAPITTQLPSTTAVQTSASSDTRPFSTCHNLFTKSNCESAVDVCVWNASLPFLLACDDVSATAVVLPTSPPIAPCDCQYHQYNTTSPPVCGCNKWHVCNVYEQAIVQPSAFRDRVCISYNSSLPRNATIITVFGLFQVDPNVTSSRYMEVVSSALEELAQGQAVLIKVLVPTSFTAHIIVNDSKAAMAIANLNPDSFQAAVKNQTLAHAWNFTQYFSTDAISLVLSIDTSHGQNVPSAPVPSSANSISDTNLIIVLVCVVGGGLILICLLLVYCKRKQRRIKLNEAEALSELPINDVDNYDSITDPDTAKKLHSVSSVEPHYAVEREPSQYSVHLSKSPTVKAPSQDSIHLSKSPTVKVQRNSSSVKFEKAPRHLSGESMQLYDTKGRVSEPRVLTKEEKKKMEREKALEEVRRAHEEAEKARLDVLRKEAELLAHQERSQSLQALKAQRQREKEAQMSAAEIALKGMLRTEEQEQKAVEEQAYWRAKEEAVLVRTASNYSLRDTGNNSSENASDIILSTAPLNVPMRSHTDESAVHLRTDTMWSEPETPPHKTEMTADEFWDAGTARLSTEKDGDMVFGFASPAPSRNDSVLRFDSAPMTEEEF